MVAIYEFTSKPPYCIVRDEEGYWLVPIRNDGWSERTPFVGRVGTLREIKQLDGIDLGLPGGSESGRH
jgi:glucose-6-phosphate 1-epimerase